MKKSIEANKRLHTVLSDVYKDTEPHYRPENIEKVSDIIHRLQQEGSYTSLLDMGCGQGFMIDIAKNYFNYIRGVDITNAMLDKVDVTSDRECDIKIIESPVEHTPFQDSSFDMCTAYAVLHHLNSLEDFFSEVYRILKPEGVFYSGLDPNWYFWSKMKEMDSAGEISGIVRSEVDKVLYKDKELSSLYHIDVEEVDLAEPFKHMKGGFLEENIKDIMYRIGFKQVHVIYDWFLGEGLIIHDDKKKQYRDVIDEYLKTCFPITKELYKYISIIAYK